MGLGARTAVHERKFNPHSEAHQDFNSISNPWQTAELILIKKSFFCVNFSLEWIFNLGEHQLQSQFYSPGHETIKLARVGILSHI
jgi:hypothetical protein